MRNLKKTVSLAIITVFLPVLFGVCRLAWAQGEVMTFSAFGDVPYGNSQIPVFQEFIVDHNRYSPSEFLVHVGDFVDTGSPCEEQRYSLVADILRGAAVPVYIVPGDNEYNDCPNPSEGWRLWEKYFTDFEQNFCGPPFTEHQSVRHENFAFVLKGVLFIGINLVGGRVHDKDEWNQRMQQDADWVSHHFQEKVSQVRGAVIFAQAGPESNRSLFFNQFRPAAAAFGKPVLFIHGDGHAWMKNNPWPEPNILRVQVNNGTEQPVQVTVTMNEDNMFAFKRNPWSSSSQRFNMPPCVEVGPDRTVAFSQSVTLVGEASDDGDPDPPGRITVRWSKVSGPGTVTFGSANALVTMASFSAVGTYVLRLTADDGELQNRAEMTITVLHPPEITSFTPSSGPVGLEVTIAGSNFTGAAAVAFNGTVAANFTVDSDAQIHAKVPEGATTGRIRVTTVAGSSSSTSDFTVVPPAISSFIPMYDTFVRLSDPATNFGASTTLRQQKNGEIEKTYLKFSVAGLNGPVVRAKLRFYVTNGSEDGGSVYVVSNNYNGTATPWEESGLNWNNAPAIGGTPLSAPQGGVNEDTWIELEVTPAIQGNGTYSFGLENNSSDRVFFSSKEGDNPPELVVETTPGSTTAPRITSFTPPNGSAETEVTITGNSFIGATIVAFNGTAATSFTVDSDSQIRAGVPVGATTGKISVANSAGTAFSAADFAVTSSAMLTFNPTHDAQVSSSNPTSNYGALNSLRVKTDNTIYKAYLKFSVAGLSGSVQQARLRLYVVDASSDGGSVYAVSNNYLNLSTPWAESGLTWNNAPAITGTPISTAGAVSLGTWVELEVTPVISGNGTYSLVLQSSSTNSVYYSSKEGAQPPELVITTGTASALAPKITSFTPSSGPMGTEVDILGSNFTNATGVTFNGIAAPSFTVDSGTDISANVPPGATAGKISVTNAHGTGWSAADFTVTYPPVITSFSPRDGGVGTPLTITGNYFTGATAVAFNGTAAPSFTVDSSTQLRANVPAGATTGKISITNADGVGLSAVDFTVTHPPSIPSFTPTSGPVGTQVTLTGNNFNGTTSVAFNGTTAQSFTVDSNTQLRAIAPPGATTGRISVTNAAGTGLSATNFVVTTIPAITSFTPVQGPVGTVVTITGTNFTGTTSVAFNGTIALSFTVDSTTQLRATVPPDATTGKIRVTNSSGIGLSAADFTMLQPPAITSFTPASGQVGAEVTITGSKFTGATGVAFNGVAASIFTVISDTQLRVNVPALATTGKIKVTNAAGAGLSASDFTVMVPFIFTPLYDAYVRLSSPAQSYPSTSALLQRITSGEVINTYLKFNVTGLSGAVQSARLRLYVTNASDDGGSVYVVSNNYAGSMAPQATEWTENGLTWENAPAIGGTALSAVGAASVDNWIELEVTPAISGNGIYSFGLKNTSSDVVNYSSKEGARAPELVIVTGAGSLPGPAITSFAPSSGYAGNEVTISGTNFSGATEIAFNGTSAPTFTLDSPTQIRANVPAGATTGKIRVATATGTALSTADFTVTSPPPTFTFAPLHDAYVRLSSPAQSYPSTPALLQRVISGEAINTYLKFNVTGLSGAVQSARLRLYVTNASDDGGSVYVVSNNYAGSAIEWTENGLTWENAPAIGGTALSAVGAASVDNWIELEVTPAISGNGIYSFGLKNASADVVNYSSKEGIHAPELVIRTVSNSTVARAMAATEEMLAPPDQLHLSPNYPNPFHAYTTIYYTLPQETNVRLLIFNTLGQLVRRLVDEMQPPGYKRIKWDGKNDAGVNAGPGVYFYQLEIGAQKLTGKMIILRK